MATLKSIDRKTKFILNISGWEDDDPADRWCVYEAKYQDKCEIKHRGKTEERS